MDGLKRHQVDCPYCGERVEILVETDLEGEMIWDCEVCCRPWELRVDPTGDSISVRASEET